MPVLVAQAGPASRASSATCDRASMPEDVAAAEMAGVERGGLDNIHFAFAGGTEPGKPHTYRIQGPTFPRPQITDTRPAAQPAVESTQAKRCETMMGGLPSA